MNSPDTSISGRIFLGLKTQWQLATCMRRPRLCHLKLVKCPLITFCVLIVVCHSPRTQGHIRKLAITEGKSVCHSLCGCCFYGNMH
jgi:hypothetical protein